MTDIGPIDYTSRDFQALVDDMRALIPGLLPEWTSRNDSDFGMVLIDLFAYVGDVLNYYIDRVANEAFLQTAVRRESVLNIAKMLNYTPISMSPASTDLTFTIESGLSTTLIPAGTLVSTVPSATTTVILFETDEDLDVLGIDAATPTYSATVSATQGQTITNEILTSVSDGAPDQEYLLFNPDVIEDSIVITVEEPSGAIFNWEKTARLLDCTAVQRCFEANLDDNDVMHILFGDGVGGRVPAAGSIVSATYRIGDGADGNVGADLVTEMVSPQTGVVSVTNATGASGGTNAETIESMRFTIPRSLTVLQRAVTLKDHAALATQVPGVAKAEAAAVVYTSVILYIAPIGGGMPSSDLKTAVQDYLADKQLVNVSVTPVDPTYVDINIAADVYVLESYFQPTVETAVTNALEKLLDFDNVDFEQAVTISQVYHAIQGVEGVDYCILSQLVRDDAATPSGVQDIMPTVGEIPEKGTITLTLHGGVE